MKYEVELITKIVRTYTIDADSEQEAVDLANEHYDDYDDEETEEDYEVTKSE